MSHICSLWHSIYDIFATMATLLSEEKYPGMEKKGRFLTYIRIGNTWAWLALEGSAYERTQYIGCYIVLCLVMGRAIDETADRMITEISQKKKMC